MSDYPLRCVAVFEDGLVLPFFDAELNSQQNDTLVKAVAAEGRRRLKAGLSDAIVIRVDEVHADQRKASA
ncbi:MAG TPA: hypothetical protein VEK08_18630 [Planctomycetota bacterium]|nr:hypothetical protein [Planctomycetota bacterium]